jgi:hypothetical protein
MGEAKSLNLEVAPGRLSMLGPLIMALAGKKKDYEPETDGNAIGIGKAGAIRELKNKEPL